MARKRDMAVINSVRKDYCEYCGSPAFGEPHHIKTVKAGGKDIRENLIQLCGECHTKTHSGHIKRHELIVIAARREHRPVEEIYELLGWYFDDKLPSEIPMESGPVTMAGRTLEDILQLYFDCLETGENSIWDQAVLLAIMSETMTHREIASSVGCSTSRCRKLVRTYHAFSNEEDRIPYLSFRHHQIAAHTLEPQKWIRAAADNSLSTRQLEELIRGDGENKKEKELAKAEKIIRWTKEVFENAGPASNYLLVELEAIVRLHLAKAEIDQQPA
ncbi:MAG: HNH endonuclease [Syntrophomonadaceae bacterium]|nr:HNH endonuclease [Syntrophomonadaceae bacterium]